MAFGLHWCYGNGTRIKTWWYVDNRIRTIKIYPTWKSFRPRPGDNVEYTYDDRGAKECNKVPAKFAEIEETAQVDATQQAVAQK